MTDSEGMAMFPTKILLATDGSEEARLAARVAVSVANGTGSDLHVVHAAPPEMAAGPHPYPTLPAETFKELEERARDFLNEQARATEELGGTVAGTHPTTGEPTEAIVRVGEEIGAGLIVVGSRGLGGMRRLVFGSVSESVARHAPCPVLVVRAEGVDAFPGKILLATDGSPEGKRAAKAAMELADKLSSELHVAYVEPLSASMLAPGDHGQDSH
jgi:nucleotide-binding universal stress UspA family protein